jgi:hypothetical protein
MNGFPRKQAGKAVAQHVKNISRVVALKNICKKNKVGTLQVGLELFHVSF